MATESFKKSVDYARQLNEITRQQIADEGTIDSTLESRSKILEQIVSNQSDSTKLGEIQTALEAKMAEEIGRGHDALAKKYELELKIIEVKQDELEAQENVNQALKEAGDTLLSGMITKGEQLTETLKKPGGMLVAGLGAALALIVAISSITDQIGEEFGTIGVKDFRHDLMGARAEAISLGYGFEEIAGSVKSLSNEFGVAFGEAIKISESSMDTARALGIGTEQAATLTGMLMTMGGHSATTAQNFLKQTAALAKSAGVAPAIIMEDIAGSSEQIALFTKDGGQNIAQAAVKARSMGLALNDVATAAESLLDFESSLTKEMEASVLIGRQLNLQRARELSLTGDLEGLQSELLKQVGTEADFNSMNLIQRKALADAVGVGVDQMKKMVTEAGKTTAELSRMRQLDISEIISDDAMSEITQFTNTLKSIGAFLLQAIAYVSNLGGGLGILIPILTAIGLWVAYSAVQGILAGVGFKAMGLGAEIGAKGLTSLAAAGTASLPAIGSIAGVVLLFAAALFGVGFLLSMLPPVIDSLAAGFSTIATAITDSIIAMAQPSVIGNIFMLALAFGALSFALFKLASIGFMAMPILGAVAAVGAIAGAAAIGSFFGAGGGDSEEESEEVKLLKEVKEGINKLVKGFGGNPGSEGEYIDEFGNKMPKEIKISNSIL